MTRIVRAWAHGAPYWAVEEEGVGHRVLTAAPWQGGVPTGELRRGRLLAPVAPSKIIGIGSNYRDHAAEMGKPLPSVPKIFLKAPSSLLAAGDSIRIPPGTQRVDHEAELGVVIGRRATRVRVEDALDYVYGVTVVNDVTARDYQKEDGVFARAKGFDTFCPVGPCVVTGLDLGNLHVGCTVNGVVRQAGTTRDMVFDVATLIAFVSSVMTLEPGDLIATGTPAGVGPLVAGDVVVVKIAGIGELSNPVEDRDDR